MAHALRTLDRQPDQGRRSGGLRLHAVPHGAARSVRYPQEGRAGAGPARRDRGHASPVPTGDRVHAARRDARSSLPATDGPRSCRDDRRAVDHRCPPDGLRPGRYPSGHRGCLPGEMGSEGRLPSWNRPAAGLDAGEDTRRTVLPGGPAEGMQVRVGAHPGVHDGRRGRRTAARGGHDIITRAVCVAGTLPDAGGHGAAGQTPSGASRTTAARSTT